MKSKLKYLFAFFLGVIISGGIVYATTINAENIIYKSGTLKSALDDLYDLKDYSAAVEVTTLTTRGSTYTMQDNGYITGTVNSSYNVAGGVIYVDDVKKFVAPWDADETYNVSIYAKKGSVVRIRDDYGTYNLKIYEFR